MKYTMYSSTEWIRQKKLKKKNKKKLKIKTKHDKKIAVWALNGEMNEQRICAYTEGGSYRVVVYIVVYSLAFFERLFFILLLSLLKKRPKNWINTQFFLHKYFTLNYSTILLVAFFPRDQPKTFFSIFCIPKYISNYSWRFLFLTFNIIMYKYILCNSFETHLFLFNSQLSVHTLIFFPWKFKRYRTTCALCCVSMRKTFYCLSSY